MGKAREIDIGTQKWGKVGDARLFFRKMLNSYPTGARVSDDDAKHLLALLDRHDEKDEKIGVGVDHFIVDAAPDGQATKCFWIVRTDGSRIDISYLHCLERKPYDRRQARG